jgi:hypothetical protein
MSEEKYWNARYELILMAYNELSAAVGTPNDTDHFDAEQHRQMMTDIREVKKKGIPRKNCVDPNCDMHSPLSFAGGSGGKSADLYGNNEALGSVLCGDSPPPSANGADGVT